MIEIIPNWHPIFVHYTLALLSLSAPLYVAGVLFKKDTFITVAQWNLWLGALITLGTVTAGLIASNTVAHDSESHAAMMDHRNWALGTAAVFGLLALWAFLNRKKTYPSALFLITMILASGALATTGYKGGELVYRHGTGVMSLPDSAALDHDHNAHEHGAHHDEAPHDGGEMDVEQSSVDDPSGHMDPNPELSGHAGHDHAH